MPASNTHFQHTLATNADPAQLWQLWTDVPNWPIWDTPLKSAQLHGPFVDGTRGTVTPHKGLSAKLTLHDVQPGKSYTLRTQLPLGALWVRRSLTHSPTGTSFTHEVWFSGLSKRLFGFLLGRNYQQVLPVVMQQLKSLAESRTLAAQHPDAPAN